MKIKCPICHGSGQALKKNKNIPADIGLKFFQKCENCKATGKVETATKGESA